REVVQVGAADARVADVIAPERRIEPAAQRGHFAQKLLVERIDAANRKRDAVRDHDPALAIAIEQSAGGAARAHPGFWDDLEPVDLARGVDELVRELVAQAHPDSLQGSRHVLPSRSGCNE